MRRLFLIRGLSGSGKTTLADLICEGHDRRDSISVDDYFLSEDGEYAFDHESFKEAHSWCLEVCESLMGENEVVVVHNTFCRKWECQPYFDLAEKLGFDIHIISLYDGGLNDSSLSERNIHGVPSHIIKKQRQKWDLDVTPNRKSYRPRKPVAPPKFIPNPYYDWNNRGRGRNKNRY
jgi:predicted kinase